MTGTQLLMMAARIALLIAGILVHLILQTYVINVATLKETDLKFVMTGFLMMAEDAYQIVQAK